MNNCERLIARRKELNLTQTGVAKMLKMSVNTINHLENDETRWRSMQTKTVDKINSFIDGTFEEEQVHTVEPVNNVEFEHKHEQTIVVIHDTKKENNVLTADDKKTLTLIEFAYEGLVESRTHNEFIANVNMLKRILNKYEF